MKNSSIAKFLLVLCLTTSAAPFLVPRPLHFHRAALTTVANGAPSSTSSLQMALQAPAQNENSHHHLKVAVAALALSSLLLTANPAPLQDATRPPTTGAFPTFLVTKEIVAEAPTTALAKLQVTPTPGFGFGGLGVSPFGIGPFGGFGGGVVIRNVPDAADRPAPPAGDARQLTKEQQLEALVKQQRQRLEQYEKLERLQRHQATSTQKQT